jgi:hypothetical protein
MVRTFILPFLLALINITAQAQSANIVGFEYWFDQNDTARSYVPLAPNATVNISNQLLNTTGLSLGQHVAHFRLKDVQNGNVRWSVVTDRALTVGQPGPYELVAVRYWWSNLANPPLDTDLRYKYFDTPQTTVQYNGLLDLCGFPTGSQLLKLQLLDNHGQWSSVVTRPVQIDSVVVVGIASISPSSMNFCPGDTVTFTATPQIGAGFATPTSYAWTVPTTDGWSAVSSTTESITVTIGNSAGNVEVVASNYCGSSVLASFAVTIPEVPAQPGPITGPLQACAGSDAVFSVPALEDLTYAWAITDGWVATGGPGASIATTIGEADAQIAVTPINACNVEGPPRIEQIVVTTPPNAGVNSSLDLCSNSDPIDLFEALNGNPETGGTWNGPNPTSGSYDPASMEPGDYLYTVTGTGSCPDATATVTVTENPLPFAGLDSNITLCGNGPPILMLSMLPSAPSGGTWAGPSPTSGSYDPTTMDPGDYLYTVSGEGVCPDDQATLTINVQQAPNAGVDDIVEICSESPTVSLFTYIGGSPQLNGDWFGPTGAAVTGEFTPGASLEGVYSYIVPGTTPCPNDTAALLVSVLDLSITEIQGPTAVLEPGELTYTIQPFLADADSIVWTFPETWSWGNDADHNDGIAHISTGNTALNDFICATAFGGECAGEQVCLPIDFTVGIVGAQQQHEALAAYPNPSSGLFRISINSSSRIQDLRVFDATGRQVLVGVPELQMDELQLDLRGHAQGAYTVRVLLKDEWRVVPVHILQ